MKTNKRIFTYLEGYDNKLKLRKKQDKDKKFYKDLEKYKDFI